MTVKVLPLMYYIYRVDFATRSHACVTGARMILESWSSVNEIIEVYGRRATGIQIGIFDAQFVRWYLGSYSFFFALRASRQPYQLYKRKKTNENICKLSWYLIAANGIRLNFRSRTFLRNESELVSGKTSVSANLEFVMLYARQWRASREEIMKVRWV